ncbi:D-inositol 3-phosphate glycosyltransferase [Aeoliella mucimassa]|uniref:D-inositol 3-phosphate glycosyltransferase n=2 Tax=Aeoliella mucimassa TaxID=2527972 RepID=A0A518AIM7_9BACT|nr:D-inositol 3-phosphate glycosyltransferase [Aeoliella mucimassa]
MDAIDLAEGGVVRCVLDLCNVLSLHDCQVTLATYNAQDVPEAWHDRPGAPQVVHIAEEPGKFQQALESATVAHLHTIWDPRNITLARQLRRRQVPYVVSLHGMLDDWCTAQKALKKKVFHWLLGRRMLEGAYRVHCTASGEEQQARKWYPQGTSVVLPLLVDMPSPELLPGPEPARQAYPSLTNGDAQLLFLSRVHPKKGVDTLLRAAALATQQGVALQVNIAGPGDEAYVAELQALAESLGIADRCHFLGLVTGDVKLSLYEAADLFVLPTHQENFGLVLPESLVCGTPVVTTKGVDIWPEIEAAGGVIVEPHPEAFADQIATLVADLPALVERGLRGRQYIADWLDAERVVEQYKKLYSDAMDHQPEGR